MPQKLLTATEFINRAIGIPWESHRADWQAMNCYGLVILYFRHVRGVELGELPKTDIADGFSRATGWEGCEAETGATCWMAWRHEAPTHCGIVLPGAMVLHSEGSEGHAGSVRVSRLSAIRRIYGEIRFYRYIPTC